MGVGGKEAGLASSSQFSGFGCSKAIPMLTYGCNESKPKPRRDRFGLLFFLLFRFLLVLEASVVSVHDKPDLV